MKKIFYKIKTGLVSFFLSSISFLSKVFAQGRGNGEQRYLAQTAYWVANPRQPELIIFVAIRALQRLLVAVVLVIWIVNLIKIKKIDDKLQKKKTKKTIITILVILIMMLLLSVVTRLLKKYRLSYQ